jgi:hypothetical protein
MTSLLTVFCLLDFLTLLVGWSSLSTFVVADVGVFGVLLYCSVSIDEVLFFCKNSCIAFVMQKSLVLHCALYFQHSCTFCCQMQFTQAVVHNYMLFVLCPEYL